MAPISYRRHRFPPVVIQHAVWLYLRFTLSYRDVEELLAERGLDIFHESVRSWVLKFDRQSLGVCGGAVLDRAIVGISTKWSSGSRASTCICGVPSTTKARSSRSWSSVVETGPRPSGASPTTSSA